MSEDPTEASGRPGVAGSLGHSGGSTPSSPVERPSGPNPKHGMLSGYVGLLAGLAAFLLILLMPTPEGLSAEGQRVAAVAALMAIWWMTEAIPLAATALLPIPLFPILGVMPVSAATAPFAHELIFLFMGGFLIALAMQRWDLHRRIALAVVATVGYQPRQLVLGFMLATAFLSMWISNTATTVMMLPIGIAILVLVDPDEGPLGTALMLGIAYAASIGGVATIIGTPPNAIFAAAAGQMLDRSVGFTQWMIVGVPLAVVMLAITWLLLVRVLHPLPADGGDSGAEGLIREKRAGLGAPSRGEKVVGTVFVLTALGWLVREPKQFGAFELPGLQTWVPLITDSVIAMAGALLLFLIPVSFRERTFALNWEWAVKIPWGVLILFGGGLSLAAGFEASGLAEWIGMQVMGLEGVPLIVLIGVVATLFVLLTELTSNTATATMGMPIMAGVAFGLGADPIILMAAAAMASSMAFMLPVATPPNAIVFGSGRVTIQEMTRAGLWLNILSITLVTLTAYFLLGRVFAAG